MSSPRTHDLLRWVERYVLAGLTVPFSVALGAGGLAQNWSRRLRGRRRRTDPVPVGRPTGSGLRQVPEEG